MVVGIFLNSEDNDFMETPEPLYHYTSQKGLIGILESKKLWMTDILYLNDSSEFLGTIELVRSELLKHKKHIKNEILSGFYLIETILKYFLSINSTNTYVFSLSKYKDNINHWRGYCPSIGGFCIEFDIDKLTTLISNNQGYKIGKCIYDRGLKKKIMNTIFGELVDESSLVVNFSKFFMGDFPFIKHESFRTEKEYRIVYFGSSNKVKYREGKSMIIPYMEFSLDSVDLPISRIIVGPTPHKELSKLSIESLLKSNGYDIKVDSSVIPYRSW